MRLVEVLRAAHKADDYVERTSVARNEDGCLADRFRTTPDR